MVLVNTISIIITEHTISYTYVCYRVNRRGIQFSVLVDQNPDCYLKHLSMFLMVMFHSLNNNHDIKEAVICHSVPVSLCAHFNPL
jgi:hypothetical protein